MDILNISNFPRYELVINIIAIIVSLLAVICWIKLYRQVYKDNSRQATGWSWLFVSVLGILLFNIASIFLIFVTSPLYEAMSIIGRTIVGVSMTVGAYLLYAPMKKGFKYKFVPILPVTEDESEIKSILRHMLERGHSYIVNEEKPVKSNEIFLELITHGVQGLYITRRNPREIREKYGLKKTPILWLSSLKGQERNIDPTDILELSHAIKEFIKKTDDGVVILDGLEYLITQNGYKDVLQFIQSLNDSIAMSNSRLIVPLDPSTLDNQQLHLLKREMTVIRTDI